MDKKTLEFVKDLIQRQHTFVDNCTDTSYNQIASGLFQNDEFNSVILELFGSGYLRESKIEFQSDPKDYLLMQLESMVIIIDKELGKMV